MERFGPLSTPKEVTRVEIPQQQVRSHSDRPKRQIAAIGGYDQILRAGRKTPRRKIARSYDEACSHGKSPLF